MFIKNKLPLVSYFTAITIFVFIHIIDLQKMNLYLIMCILLAGYDVFIDGFMDTYKNSKREKRLILDTHILMFFATIGAMLINRLDEAYLLVFIFAGAHFLEEAAESKSKKEMETLLSMKPTIAKVVLGNEVKEIDIHEVEIGDIIEVVNGEQIPIDGIIVKGKTTIDESSITGESFPVEKMENDEVFGGTVNLTSAIRLKVNKNLEDTLFLKILKLVDEAQQNRSPIQTFITKFQEKYVKLMLLLVPIVFVVLFFVLKWDFTTSFYRTVIFLVIVSPCALAVSATPAILSSISLLSKYKTLVKGGSHVVNFKNLKAIAFDKTGTLTTGKMRVKQFVIVNDKPYMSSLVKTMESQSNHPIATAIVSYLQDINTLDNVVVHNELGYGIKTVFENHTYTISKPDYQAFKEIILTESEKGATAVTIKEDEKAIGYIILEDSISKEAFNTIAHLKSLGIRPIMVTGDNQFAANYVAQQLGIEEVYAGVLPTEKDQIIKKIKEKHGLTAMIGDGVNDSIALSNADISIAMGQGSDVAIESADMILMSNDLSKILMIYNASKRLNHIIKQNMIFALSVIILLVILNFIEYSNILFSVIGHEGSTILIILNSLRMLVKK